MLRNARGVEVMPRKHLKNVEESTRYTAIIRKIYPPACAQHFKGKRLSD